MIGLRTARSVTTASVRGRRASLAMLDGAIWFVASAALLGPALLGPALFGPALVGPAAVGPGVVGPAGSAWSWLGAVAAITAQWILGYASGLYRGRARIGSADQALLLARVVGSAGTIALVVILVLDGSAAGSWAASRAVIVTTAVVLLAAGVMRFAIRRLLLEHRPLHSTSAQRVLIFGAGSAGQQLLQSMIITGRLRHGGGRRAGDLLPVGLLDDDRARQRLRILGVPVLGTGADIARVAQATGATMMVLAVPSGDAALVSRVAENAVAAGLTVKTLPSLAELATPDSVGVGDMRDVEMADLLGRHQIDTDVAAIAGYLTGKRVLVTGAGGSIGSELCRQIHRFAPAELIMLDRDESALHAVQLSIHGVAALDTSDVVLADIRDVQHVLEVFIQRRPEVVFHAAALKHLTMLEQYPGEAVKTNVWGTATVLRAAKAAGVHRFVNISTDKAANPVSVLGYTKRLAEGLTAAAAADSNGTYLSVRFGNVLGSRGSVITTFTAQIESGGPVTVTDPEVTRYFMTIEEAVQLVIQAAAIGRDGEALVLDMGAPVRIADVAKQLIKMSGRSVDIVYTGLHDGEKLHEELFGHGEQDHRPIHHLISHVPVVPLEPASTLVLEPQAERAVVVERVAALCRTSRPAGSDGHRASELPAPRDEAALVAARQLSGVGSGASS